MIGKEDKVVAKQKLTYHFHNPNTPEATANFLLKLFVEVNKPKVEQAIQLSLAAEKSAPDDLLKTG
jgi:hypothetical protein